VRTLQEVEMSTYYVENKANTLHMTYQYGHIINWSA